MEQQKQHDITTSDGFNWGREKKMGTILANDRGPRLIGAKPNVPSMNSFLTLCHRFKTEFIEGTLG